MPDADTHGGYCLKLANGQGWQLVGSEGAAAHVAGLARAMRLPRASGNGEPRLLLVPGRADGLRSPEPAALMGADLRAGLPAAGWQAQPMGHGWLWTHPEASDAIFEMPHESRVGQQEALDVGMMWLALTPVYHWVLGAGGFPFHAGLIERDGVGVLLSAPGKLGKSTCCRRLQLPWQALCDDEAIVVPDGSGGYRAHPFPTWSALVAGDRDRSWESRRHAPVAGLFFLEQSPVESFEPIGQARAATLVNIQAACSARSCCWGGDSGALDAFKRRLFANACEFAKAVPAFVLRVSLQGRFWERIEAALPQLKADGAA